MKRLAVLGEFNDAREAPYVTVDCGDDAYSTEAVKATIEKMAIESLWNQHGVRPVKMMWLDPGELAFEQVLETRTEGFE